MDCLQSPLIRDKTADFLCAIGITTSADHHLLPLAVDASVQFLKAEINSSHIPDPLLTAAVFLAASFFLRLCKTTGSLPNIDLDSAVKQIQQGDTSVTFAVGSGSSTPEQRLDTIINTLSDSGRRFAAPFRRLAW